MVMVHPVTFPLPSISLWELSKLGAYIAAAMFLQTEEAVPFVVNMACPQVSTFGESEQIILSSWLPAPDGCVSMEVQAN
jgi:hypothetical protein